MWLDKISILEKKLTFALLIISLAFNKLRYFYDPLRVHKLCFHHSDDLNVCVCSCNSSLAASALCIIMIFIVFFYLVFPVVRLVICQ